MAVKDYSANPDENTTISGINIAEGCAPSGINNAIRQLMADVKQESEDQSKVMTGATASAAGKSGNVPVPDAGKQDKPLNGAGQWADFLDCVVTAIKDPDGNIDATKLKQLLSNYLPLTGGTLTGQLKFNILGTEDYLANIVAVNDQNGKRLVIDTKEVGDNGAFIELRKGSDTINPGGFTLAARDINENLQTLIGYMDGRLLWRGRRLVESISGVTPDANGNIRIVQDAYIGDGVAGFTMPWDGFVIGRFAGGNGQEFRIYRNGDEILYARQADQGYGTLAFPFCVAAYAGEWITASYGIWYGVRAVRK